MKDIKEKPTELVPKSNVAGKIPKAALKKAWTEATEKSRTKLRENISAQGMVADTFHSAVKQNTDFTIIQTGTCRGEAPPSCCRKTVRSLKSPTGAFIVPLRSTNAKLSNSVHCFALWNFHTLLNHSCNIRNRIAAVVLEPF